MMPMNRIAGFLFNLFVSGVIIFFGLLPTLFAIGAWVTLSPTDFWQKLVLLGVMLFFFGGLQFVLGVVALGVLLKFWE